MQTVWLQPPDGGPAIEVEDDGRGENLTPFMVKGYKQVPAPGRPAEPAREPLPFQKK